MAVPSRLLLLVLASVALFFGSSSSHVMGKSAAEWEKAAIKEMEELDAQEREEDDKNLPPADSTASMIMVEMKTDVPGWRRESLLASAQTWREVMSTGGIILTMFDTTDTELAVTLRDMKQVQTTIDYLVKQEHVSKVVYKYVDYFPDGTNEKQTKMVGIEDLERMGMKMGDLGSKVEGMVKAEKDAKEDAKKSKKHRRRRRKKGKKPKQEL